MILRNPDAACREQYDLIVVGGGIYGVMLAYEAVLRELSVLLVERDDFGAQTSYNSLKTIHGGLRRLRSLDVRGYRAFAREQRWFLETFPHLVRPLPVLMPLYGEGMQRASVFRTAFLLARLFAPQEAGGHRVATLPRPRVISTAEIRELFPGIDPSVVRGGALWYDATMPDTQRLLVDVLRWACAKGATALNYFEAVELLGKNGRVSGIRARETGTDTSCEFRSRLVVNAAGPWTALVANRFAADGHDLFYPSLAWNVLFDRKADSDAALALAPARTGGRLFFFHPWKGRLLVGTGHAPRSDFQEGDEPSSEELHVFLNEVNAALPGLRARREDVLHVFSGYLPVSMRASTRLRTEDRFIDHGREGGPHGLFSVSGTRYTASRSAAEKALTHLFPDRKVAKGARRSLETHFAPVARLGTDAGEDWDPDRFAMEWGEELRRISREESVCHLDDLILRRTSLGDDPVRSLELAEGVATILGMTGERRASEMERLKRHFKWLAHTATGEVTERSPAT